MAAGGRGDRRQGRSPDGTLAWATSEPGATFNLDSEAGFQVHELDGTLVDTWNTVDMPTDFHDFQMLENGNAMIGAVSGPTGDA